MFVQAVGRRFLSAYNNHVEFRGGTKIYNIEVVEMLNRSDYVFSSSLLGSSQNLVVLLFFPNTIESYFTCHLFFGENKSVVFATRYFERL